MKKYTLEQLQNLTEQDVFEIAKAIKEKKVKFSGKEKDIVYTTMHRYYAVYEHLAEYNSSARNIFHAVSEEEEVALKEAYLALFSYDWENCKSALKVFSGLVGSDIQHLDISLWDISHILRWRGMLYQTGIHDDPQNASVLIFWDKINEAIENHRGCN